MNTFDIHSGKTPLVVLRILTEKIDLFVLTKT